MSLIVQKYGGTSLMDTGRIRNVAERISTYHSQGHRLCVVLSAMGHTTDGLVKMATELNPNPAQREMDMLLSTGEQVSIALMAMTLEAMQIPAISFTGGQVGIVTDGKFSDARIQKINQQVLHEQMDQGRVCIVAGFQGIDNHANITTLGRGGSDTSAVALAVALEAAECEIFTDVDGVYTTDPNKVPSARKLSKISYEEMLELARMGAGVLHSRSVELASKHKTIIHVRSSLNNSPGTLVVPEEQVMEKAIVRGASLKTDEARISVVDIPDRPGLAAELFSHLSQSSVNVDMIVQSSGKDSRNTISFTVPEKELKSARELVSTWLDSIGSGSFDVEDKIAIVSIVGVGMKSHSGIAARMFQALAEIGTNIQMISTSEIKVSVVVSTEQGRSALTAVHDAFELGKAGS